MSKKEIDHRFRYPYKGKVNKCPKCCGLLEYQAQAGSMPPSIRCTACSWRYYGRESVRPDFDVLRSMVGGAA